MKEAQILLANDVDGQLGARAHTAAALAAIILGESAWEPWVQHLRHFFDSNGYIQSWVTYPLESIPVTEISNEHLQTIADTLSSALTQDQDTQSRLALAAEAFLSARAEGARSNERFLGMFKVTEILAGLFEPDSSFPTEFAELATIVGQHAAHLGPLLGRLKALGMSPPLRDRFLVMAESLCPAEREADEGRFGTINQQRGPLVHGKTRRIDMTDEQDPHEIVAALARRYLLAVARDRAHLEEAREIGGMDEAKQAGPPDDPRASSNEVF